MQEAVSRGGHSLDYDPTGLQNKVSGDEALKEGRFEEAIAFYTAGLAAFCNSLPRFHRAGSARSQSPPGSSSGDSKSLEEVEVAKAVQEKEAAEKAAMFALYFQRSCALSITREFKFALADANKCIALKPDNPRGHFRKGVALEGQRKYKRALEAYQVALSLDPANSTLLKKFTECQFKANATKYGYAHRVM